MIKQPRAEILITGLSCKLSSQFKGLAFDVWRNRFKVSWDLISILNGRMRLRNTRMRNSETSFKRVPNTFLGIRDSPYLKLGIWGFKAKSGRNSGLKVCAGGGVPKITLGITGLKIPNGDPLLRLQLGTLEVDSNLHICNCHVKRQLKLASQYASISNWPLLTWKWHLWKGNVI